MLDALMNKKNHQFLIDIFYKTQKTLPNSALLLIGEGPLMESVKEQARLLGLKDKVIFLGRRTDVADLYNVMDIFVLPSLFEGLGIVLIEAQANGLPCLLTDKIPEEAIVDKAFPVSLSETPRYWSKILIEQIHANKDIRDIERSKFNSFDITMASAQLTGLYHRLAVGKDGTKEVWYVE